MCICYPGCMATATTLLEVSKHITNLIVERFIDVSCLGTNLFTSMDCVGSTVVVYGAGASSCSPASQSPVSLRQCMCRIAGETTASGRAWR